MTDIAQLNLREPEPVDWDQIGKSSYSPPPPALGADGRPITYYGQVETIKEVDPDEDYLNYQVDFKIIRSGNGVDGARLRTWLSARPFMRRSAEGNLEPVKGNPNKLAQYLRSAGLQAKPQTNSEYRASVNVVRTKPVAFTIDWEARNKDTGEVIRGYAAFPEDPARPGQKKSILKTGDVYNEVDSKGNIIGVKRVESEILFANARLKYFQDPTPKVR